MSYDVAGSVKGSLSRAEGAPVEMHPGQLTVSEATVRALVAEQFPEWRTLEVRAVRSSGTVNALFRIGEPYVARLPLLAGEVEVVRRQLESEAAAARELLGRTRFATPTPVAIAEPGAGYPMPWSVQTWLPGTVAWDADPGTSTSFARDLAAFIGEVRTIPTGGRRFRGTGRGGDLRRHDAWIAECLRRSADLFDVDALRQLWMRFRDLPDHGGDVMTHGDLIPGNVLVADGRLTGVLDVGGLGPADPALDLVAAWHLLERRPREVLRIELDSDDLEWARGAAWAYEQALGAAWYYLRSNPAMSSMGIRTLHRIVTEAPALP